jgi:hypothetical protein
MLIHYLFFSDNLVALTLYRKHDKLTVLKVLDGGPEGGEVGRPHGFSSRDPSSGLVLQEGGQEADSCSRNDDIRMT